MNGKLYFAKIDVTKIDKSKLFKGDKGTYLDLSIWINDEPDKYDNTMSLQQSTKKGEDKIYLGNGKEYSKPTTEQNGAVQSDEVPPEVDDSGLPF